MSKSSPTPEEVENRIAEARVGRAITLDLSDMGLTTLPESLGQCKALQWLDLRNNQLTTLPASLGHLTALRTLFLDNNQLTTLPASLGHLTALQALHLDNNELATLPESLGQCKALQSLHLENNQLTTLPKSLGQCTALQELHLENNRLTTLPESLGQCKPLRWLDLDSNQLTTLPKSLGQCRALEWLRLDSNQLTTLPESLRILKKLERLFLSGNDALGLPSWVLNKSERPSEILDYYFRIHPVGSTTQGSELRELKIIIIGRGEVGKSSLVEVLQGMPFVPGKAPTEGIAITRWKLALNSGEATALVWDFGGQSIMHGTHQFFLTHRTLYLVVVDWRHDRQNQDAENWLKYVQTFGGKSTAFLVMNKQGAGREYPYDVDRVKLSRRCGVKLENFFPTDCEDAASIDTLREAILREAEKMLTEGELFPPEFMPIRERLGAMKEDFFSDEQYRQLCRKLGVPEKEGTDEYATALRWLSDLGTVVSFPEDMRLAHLTVLNPEWVTEGIYRVLTDKALREQRHGELALGELGRMLPAARWPRDRHQYLIDLMEKFELCFPLEGKEETLLVPELLPDAEPLGGTWEAGKCLVFQYRYTVLPHGVLPRFITRTHEMSYKKARWRSGVVLAGEEAEAVVRGDHDAGLVEVWVRGKHANDRRALLAQVRGHFKTIHQRMEGLAPEEHVSVLGHPTVTVAYADALQDERDGKTTIRVTIEGKRVDWPLGDLLNGVESEEERERRTNDAQETLGAGHRSITINAGSLSLGDIAMNDEQSKNIEVTARDIVGSPIGIDQRLGDVSAIIGQQALSDKKKLLEQLQVEAAKLIKALPTGQQEEASDNLKMLVKQANADKPKRQWYSLSANGLIEASAFVKDFTGNIAGTIGKLGKLLWPDFMLPPGDQES